MAVLNPGIQVDPAILDIAWPNGISDPFTPLVPNLASIPLLRSGAATGQQSGSIVGMGAKVKVQIPVMGGQVLVFNRLVLYNTNSREGDSGAAVVDARDNSVVGMHLAGGSGKGLYLQIQVIFNALGVVLF